MNPTTRGARGHRSRECGGFTRALPGLRWCELESHGYVVVDVAPEEIALQWWFVGTVLERTRIECCGQELLVRNGDARLLQPIEVVSVVGS